MNDTANQAYTYSTASMEIILLLLGAFILGALLCKLLKMAGLCCRRAPQPEAQPLSATEASLARARARPSASATPTNPAPRMPAPGEGMAYEADLHSLLRGRRTENETTASTFPASTPAPVPVPAPVAAPSRSAPSFTRSPTPAATPRNNNIHLDMPDDNHVDDLKKLEGIGPRIEKLLNEAGIKSYAKLATMDRDALKAILEKGGSQFKLHEPKSWPYQAELAAKQNWQRLKEYQDFLLSERDR